MQSKATASIQLKLQVFEKLGQIAATLGSPARLKLIQLLAQSPKTVEELSQISGESTANTSQHLQKLAKEGLVYSTRQGLRRVYEITNPRVIAVWESLQELAHELSPALNEAEGKITDSSLRSPHSVKEMLGSVKKDKAMLVDIREEKEALATPVQGAISIPLAKLKSELDQLPINKVIYVFCRGRYCSMATDAVRLLREKGFTAYRLRESSFVISSHQSSGKRSNVV